MFCSINFTKKNRKFGLSFHYNGADSYLFVSGTEIIKFKAKHSKIVATPLFLGNKYERIFWRQHTKKNRIK